MSDLKVLKESLSKLNIPFDKSFFNLPFSHYETLVEDIGMSKVHRHCRDILIHYKNDPILSEKARILLRKLTLNESTGEYPECECGFVITEDYDKCPVCGKKLYDGDKCFYTNDDNSCSLDGEECKWKNTDECGKLDKE